MLITDKATEFLKTQVGEGQYFYISLRSGGCSGFMTEMDVISEPDDTDKVIECNGIKVCIPAKSYLYLASLEVDYIDDTFNKGLILRNPQATRTCGCGKSSAFGN